MKTLIWLIGKPGTGKTTVGDSLQNGLTARHFSYGQLLKDIQPSPSLEGYSEDDRRKVNETIVSASKTYSTIIVDGNPYSRTAFGFIDVMRPHFDKIFVLHLTIDDTEALTRLEKRGREVPAHDGSSEKDRVASFNTKLLPLIQESREEYDIRDIDVAQKTTEQVVAAINLFSSVRTI